MAVRSREFVGIAEGIRSHELSTKGLIENLNIEISELSDEVSSVSHEISHLEAEIAAAYEDTDEDGEPNYGLIAALEGKKELKEARLMRKEQELHSTEKELDAKKAELKAVEEEKAQTLFEIQERARKTSANIGSVSNAYGAYAAAAARLQSSLQSSFSSLSQAAGILGGSVSGGGSGTASGGGYSAPRKAGGVSGSINTESGSLAAFTSGYSDGRSFSSSASRFSTNQSQLVTPAAIGGYRSGKGTFQAKTIQNFVSGQNANEYTSGSFMDHVSAKTSPQNVNTYNSSQESLTMEKNFGVSEVPEETIHSEGNRKHTFADWINPENYQNGQYIGAGQEWGYKPYGKDSVEYESGILTPEQQKLNRYMQEHNYEKSDFSVYSKDREWQALYKAAYPDISENKSSRIVSEKRMKVIASRIRNRAHKFFEYFIRNIKDNLTEKSETAKSVNQIIADVYNDAATDNTASRQEQFENFDLEPIKNGSDFFVKGTNYDQFIDDYYNSEKSIYESLGKNEIIKTVSPDNIEGIHLGKTEVANSSIFWSQHESGGSRESFLEIASHIPEVENLLQTGLSLDEIRENHSLEKCVNIYFEPSNIPKVIQSHGYYEFETNGRHRILAAREAGYNIPVKIVGIRRWN
ncbi:hypothetical protein GPK60_13395 [Ruminococcus sp. MCC718]|uniref:hypothetical protein n=1 Tax=Ruminococcus sp. MCC718 TaxID=2592649 RepID=UPI001C01FB33|nr:hypothetical protein [Ruminococcus sp. MCC718]MBT9653998.1 hypothetical protein [Ruminococcus sp. MCC718]